MSNFRPVKSTRGFTGESFELTGLLHGEHRKTGRVKQKLSVCMHACVCLFSCVTVNVVVSTNIVCHNCTVSC